MRAAGIAMILWLLTLLVTASAQSRSAYPGLLDQHPAIDYPFAAVNDVVTQLRRDITIGTKTLTYDGEQGYLRSVLDALNVPVESQLLVFSKTGVQNAHTSPEHPRALYFNDRVVIGYIPGAPFLEMAAHDPKQGVIFQTLVQSSPAPQFARPDRCLSCHRSENSLEVPGILVRSNFAAPDGRAMPQLGSFVVDSRSPFEQRWGGWYVTGANGALRHMGNAFVTDPSKPEAAMSAQTVTRSSLDARVEVALYPAATSDVAALMVFDHQGRAMNLLTRLGWETRIAAAYGAPDFSKGELRDAVTATVDYLMFVDEARLPAPVGGGSTFARTFAQQGPRDRQGRSLRDLDLQTRFFKYRCSYMIYSPAFDALPIDAKREVLTRLSGAITDRDTLAILDATKPGWRE
jgi:hypothetical protein